MAGEGFLDDKAEKVPQTFAAGETGTRQDFFESRDQFSRKYLRVGAESPEVWLAKATFHPAVHFPRAVKIAKPAVKKVANLQLTKNNPNGINNGIAARL